MKRIISMIILAAMMLSAAAPALAADCYYYDAYGTHAYEQTSFAYPTCTTPGYVILECSACGKTLKDETGDAYGHDWYESGEMPATCTEQGVIYYCCGECYEEKTEIVKALGHQYTVQQVIEKATCVSGGKESVKCSRCGKTTTRETGKIAHKYGEWNVAVAATDSSVGTRTRKCADCGAEQTEQYYPDGTLYSGIGNKDAVKVLQTWLTDCGYLNDTIDGIFGKKTEQAVRDFQTRNALSADGIVWPETLKLLEKEWQILMGIYVEYCTRVEDENGVVEFVYCEEHKALMDEINEILAVENAEQTKAEILTGICAMHQAEVDALYAEWLEGSADEEKANVTASQAMFAGYLNTQKMVWNKQYGENSEEALTKVSDMLHDQWVDLCGIVDIFCAE